MKLSGKQLEGRRVYVPSAVREGEGAIGTVKMYDPRTSSYLVELDQGGSLWCALGQMMILRAARGGGLPDGDLRARGQSRPPHL